MTHSYATWLILYICAWVSFLSYGHCGESKELVNILQRTHELKTSLTCTVEKVVKHTLFLSLSLIHTHTHTYTSFHSYGHCGESRSLAPSSRRGCRCVQDVRKSTRFYCIATHVCSSLIAGTRWLRFVGSKNIQVSFAEYSLFDRSLLLKRPMILSILLTEGTPHV